MASLDGRFVIVLDHHLGPNGECEGEWKIVAHDATIEEARARVSYDHIVRTEPCSDYEATKKEPITLEYSRTGELRDGDIYEFKEVE